MEKSVPDGDGCKKSYRNYSASDMIEAARLVQPENFCLCKAAKNKHSMEFFKKISVGKSRSVQVYCYLFEKKKKMGMPFALDAELEQNIFNYILQKRLDVTIFSTQKRIQHKPEDHMWNVDETWIMYVVKPGRESGDRNRKEVNLQKKLWRTRRKYDMCRLHTYSLECGFQESLSAGHLNPSVRKRQDNKGTFYNLVQIFLESTTGSPRPILLLIDSHGSHITPEVIELARSNYVHMLTFPSLTTHILQPLYAGVYKALKCYFQYAICEKHSTLCNNLGEPVNSVTAAVHQTPSFCQQIQSTPADAILKVTTPGPRSAKITQDPQSTDQPY
ncbi:hypothetical protein PR048_018982 [Dryococelus australis]|uniref:DDE-1 domain-containing protein n=1 Tax=Dryococelus australis TaxID=614101 RepID=A0ABQ9H291_9NEOP|nr:hypothetical protein PR048_018982 [Dryococelus australis]